MCDCLKMTCEWKPLQLLILALIFWGKRGLNLTPLTPLLPVLFNDNLVRDCFDELETSSGLFATWHHNSCRYHVFDIYFLPWCLGTASFDSNLTENLKILKEDYNCNIYVIQILSKKLKYEKFLTNELKKHGFNILEKALSPWKYLGKTLWLFLKLSAGTPGRMNTTRLFKDLFMIIFVPLCSMCMSVRRKFHDKARIWYSSVYETLKICPNDMHEVFPSLLFLSSQITFDTWDYRRIFFSSRN